MNAIGATRSFRYAVAAAMICGALLAAGCGARRAEQHLKTGDTYLQLGKLNEAAQEYDRALSLDPKSVRAQFGRGAVLARQHKSPEALAEFSKAIDMDPAFEPAYVESLRLLLAEKKYDEAEALAKRLKSAHPESSDVMVAGICLETGRADEAVNILEERRKASPDSVKVRIALAKAYLAANQPDKSEAELKAMVDAGGEGELPGRMALVEVYRAQGKLDQTVQELKSLSAERPEDMELKLVLARALLESGNTQEAYDTAEPVLQQAPDNPWANYVIGSCLVAQKQYEDAIPYLETAARSLPQQPALERELTIARSAGKAVAPDGKAAPGAVAATTPETPAAPAAEGAGPVLTTADIPWQTLWQKSQLVALIENRNEYLSKNPDDLLLKETLAMTALFLGRADVAKEMLERLPAESPAAAFATAVLAGDNEKAVKTLDAWGKESGDRKVLERNALGSLLAGVGLRGQAMMAFAEAGRLVPDNVVFLENLARMYRGAQMPEFAAGALQKLLSRYPENIEARQLLFQVYLENDKLKDAKGVAENMYGLFPDQREAVLALAQVYTLLGQTDLAADVLTRGMEKQPGDPGFALAMASVRLAEGKPADALELVKNAGEIPAQMGRMRRNVVAFAQAAQGNWTDAAATAGTAEDVTGMPALALLRAAALATAGQNAEAVKSLQRPDGSVSSEPRVRVLAQALGAPIEGLSAKQSDLAGRLAAKPTALAQYGYGLACLEAGLPQAAIEAFDRAEQEAGEHPYFVLGRMQAFAKMPESSDRLVKAQALAENRANVAEAWLGLATLLQETDDVAGVRQALDKARDLAPDEPLVWLQRAIFADKQKDLPMAVEAFAKLTALEPQNPAFHNNYAYYLLESNGDSALALSEAQMAFERMPGSPNVLHTLGLAALRTGDLQKAYENLRAAVERRPGDPTLLLDYGQVLMQRNEVDEGRRHVAMALQCADLLQLDFPRRPEAEKIVPTATATATPAAQSNS